MRLRLSTALRRFLEPKYRLSWGSVVICEYQATDQPPDRNSPVIHKDEVVLRRFIFVLRLLQNRVLSQNVPNKTASKKQPQRSNCEKPHQDRYCSKHKICPAKQVEMILIYIASDNHYYSSKFFDWSSHS
jgi:hypothetical protein